MDILSQTYFQDILHSIAQFLLLPVIIALMVMIVYALWSIGTTIAEAFTDRRHFKVNMPVFLDEVQQADPSRVHEVVAASSLLGAQKHLLLTLWDHRTLDVDSHVALAKRLMEEQENRFDARVARTQSLSRVAPQLGLMATLIPLGPGIVSLGQGDAATLSTSLLVAFDATVAGLLVSALTYAVTRIRRSWYDNYMSAMEAASTAILEKVDEMRRDGTMDTDAPTDYADAAEPVSWGEKRRAKAAKRDAESQAGIADAGADVQRAGGLPDADEGGPTVAPFVGAAEGRLRDDRL